MSAPSPLTCLAEQIAARLLQMPNPAAAPHPFLPLIIDSRFGRAIVRANYSAELLDAAGLPCSQVSGLSCPLEALGELYRNLPIYRVYSIEKKIEILRQRTAAAYADLCAVTREVRR